MRFKIVHDCNLDEYLIKSGGSFFSRLRTRLHATILASETNTRLVLLKRSVAAIKAEQRRQLTNTDYRYVIHPFSELRVFWQTVMLWVYALSFFFIPFSYVFKKNGKNISTLSEMRYYELCLLFVLSIFCMLDIVMNFLTGIFVEHTREIILDRRLIVRKYLLGYFAFDLIHSLPLQFVFYHTLGEYMYDPVTDTHENLHMRIAFLFSVLRVFRIVTFLKLFTQFFEMIGVRAVYARLMRAVVVMLLAVHWSACWMYHLPFLVNGNEVMEKPMHQVFGFSWVNSFNLRRASTLRRYSTAVFYVSHVFTAVGMCQPKDHFMIEDLITLALLSLATIIINAYLFMTFFHVATSSSQSAVKYMDVKNQLEKFMQLKQLPEELQDKFTAYYDYRYNGRYFDEHHIVSSLPGPTLNSLNMYACRHLVENVALFYYLPRRVLHSLVNSLQLEVYLPNDVIIRSGTPGDCMYFLSSGTVAVIMSTGKEVCHLTDGAHFGELCLLRADHVRGANVVALESCEVYRLGRPDFEQVVAAFPTLRAQLAGLAQERAAYAFKVNEAYKEKLVAQQEANEIPGPAGPVPISRRHSSLTRKSFSSYQQIEWETPEVKKPTKKKRRNKDSNSESLGSKIEDDFWFLDNISKSSEQSRDVSKRDQN